MDESDCVGRRQILNLGVIIARENESCVPSFLELSRASLDESDQAEIKHKDYKSRSWLYKKVCNSSRLRLSRSSDQKATDAYKGSDPFSESLSDVVNDC